MDYDCGTNYMQQPHQQPMPTGRRGGMGRPQQRGRNLSPRNSDGRQNARDDGRLTGGKRGQQRMQPYAKDAARTSRNTVRSRHRGCNLCQGSHPTYNCHKLIDIMGQIVCRNCRTRGHHHSTCKLPLAHSHNNVNVPSMGKGNDNVSFQNGMSSN